MKEMMRWIEITAVIIRLQQHLRKGFGVARPNAGIVCDELVHHLQLAPDQPIERVDPQHRRQRLRKKNIIRMSAADMRQFMVEDLPVNGIPDIGTFLPEEIVQKGKGRPPVLYFDQYATLQALQAATPFEPVDAPNA